MREYIEIGSTPCDEECAQVGADDYAERSRKECRAYIGQLGRTLAAAGKEKPEGLALVVRGQSHDFGTYHEVACRFDDSDEDACELAYWIEANGPTRWDDIARVELGLVELGSAEL